MIPKDRILDKLDSLLADNDYAGAKRLLQYWFDEAKLGGDRHGVLLIENEWMGLCRKLGEKEDALKHAQNALDLVGEMGIGDSVGAATTYLNSATVCKAFGLAEDALNLFRIAREIYERDLAPTDDRLAGLYNNTGLALVDVGEYAQARELYEKALSILGDIPQKEPEMAITCLNLASAAEAEYGLEEAQRMIAEFCDRAKTYLEIGRDRRDGGYAFACEKCASVFGFYGYEDYARVLLERCRRIYEGT